jgi:hypothetical protein
MKIAARSISLSEPPSVWLLCGPNRELGSPPRRHCGVVTARTSRAGVIADIVFSLGYVPVADNKDTVRGWGPFLDFSAFAASV